MGSRSVVIIGYFGFGNAGDEAILAGLLSGLRERDPKIRATVISGNSADTESQHGVLAIPWPDLEGIAVAIEKSDGVVVGGGGLFHDYWGVDPDTMLTDRSWGIPSFVAPVLLAALHGKPAVLAGVGVGPLRTSLGRALTRQICDLAACLTVRDPASADLLVEIGVARERVEVTADFAFNFVPSEGDRKMATALLPEGDGPLVAFCLRNWEIGVHSPRWETEVAAAADLLIRTAGARIVFVPFQNIPGARENDVAVSERVLARLSSPERASVVPTRFTPGLTAALLSRCDAVLGMRLHSLLFALCGGIPAVALSYDPKVAGLMASLGLDRETVDLAEVERISLADAVRRALSSKDTLAGRIRPNLEKAIVAARTNIDRIWAQLDRPPSRPGVPGRELFIKGIRAQIRSMALARTDSEGDRARVSHLDGVIEERGIRIAALERQSATLEAGLSAKDQALIASTQEHEATRETLTHLEGDLTECRRELAVRDGAAEATNRELEAGRHRISDLERQSAMLEASLSAKDQALVVSNLEHGATREALVRLDADLTACRRELANRDAVVEATNLELEAERHLTRSQQAKLAAKEHEVQAAVRRSRGTRELLATSIENARMKQEEVAALVSELSNFTKRLAETSAKVKHHETDVETLYRENTRLVEALDKTRREVHDWKAAHDDAREGLECVRDELRRWYASRLFKAGNVYWRILRGLTGRPPVPYPVALPPKLTPSPASPEPVAEPKPVRTESPRPSGIEPEPHGRYDVLVFPIIDWDFRFQRPQQIAAQFGRRGHRVLYLSATQFLPEGGPAWQTVIKQKNVAEVRIRSARGLDIYGGKLEERDLEVLEESFAALAKELCIADAVCKVDIPFWTPLVFRLRERFGWSVVYDCMDEWNNFPGFGGSVLAAEEVLVRRADVTLVSADRLMEKWQAVIQPTMVRNGVDLEHYRRLYAPNQLLGKVRHPVIGYYGALASWVDVPLLEKVARAFPDGTIVLAGGQFDVDLSSVAALGNVRFLGQRPYDEMPGLLWNFDACIIPFLVNDITEATNPVKFYEYISQGKPVVSPDLTELRPFQEACYLANGHDDFISKLRLALAEPADDPRRARRKAIAASNDWSARTESIDEAVRKSVRLVSVVVVSYGGLALTKACLLSLLQGETWPRLELIVVDNASSDETPAFLRDLAAKDERVRVILNATNRGFAAANNQGIAASTGEVIVLLNNDTVVPPGLLGRLVAHLRRDPDLGLICPTTNFCGNEAKVDPDYTSLSGLPAYAARRAAANAGVVFDIPIAAMYCVALRREVYKKVGPLDEAFGIGMFEDDDYALRIRGEGLRVVCAEDAYVHHVGQGAFCKLPRDAYEKLWKENRATFEKKWGRPWKPHQIRGGVSAPASKIQ